MSNLQTDSAVNALKDGLSDGQWHSTPKILKIYTKSFNSQSELMEVVKSLVDDGVLKEGNNSSFRMVRDTLMLWRTSRGLPLQATPSTMSAPRLFAGILEDDGWETAPLKTMDVVHFHSNSESADKVAQAVGYLGMTMYNFEGLTRIYTIHGTLIADIVQGIKNDEGDLLDISSIRIDRGTKRRELSDLPVDFVNELCAFYGEFAHALIRQSMSSVRKHIAERDDIQQQIYLWIIDAIQRYDNETSIPFAAYLHSAINRWVHDLARKEFGRAVADSELQISRAKADFQVEHNRAPTVIELSDVLQEPIEKVKKKLSTVSSVSHIRDASPLIIDDYEIPLVASESATDRVDEESRQSIISAALTTSAIEFPKGPAIIAWCSIYNRFWGSEKISDRTNSQERELLEAMRGKVPDYV